MNLLQAARGGDAEECRRLMAGGGDPNVRNSKRFTPLHIAAQQGHVDVEFSLKQEQRSRHQMTGSSRPSIPLHKRVMLKFVAC
jgi:ankyrin repeat protein